MLPWLLAALSACAAAGADYACRRLHVTSLFATTFAVVAFGLSAALGARSCVRNGGDPRASRFATLGGAALFAVASYVILVRREDARPAAAGVAALLDFGFAAVAGALGVAREVRRGRAARSPKR